jgi:OOP family OmpA-OmpF porin
MLLPCAQILTSFYTYGEILMKNTFIHCLSIGVLSSSLAMSVSAAGNFTYPSTDNNERSGGITFTPMIGNLNLDDDRNVDGDNVAGLGLGYRFSAPYMVEFVYLTGDAETQAGADLGDLRQYRLEMLYDIGNYGKFNPYLALGAASTEFGDNSDDEGAISAGVGARYNFTERVALRGDARYLRAVENNKDADVYLGLGLQIFLGKTSKPAPVEEVSFVEPKVEAPSFAERCKQAGGFVNAENCVKKVASTDKTTLNVEFETNSNVVRADYLTEIVGLASFMDEYPTVTAVIGGHTDSIGSAEYNQSLSQRRVNEVARLLSDDYGIDASRLSAIGYGETQPVVANDTAENRAKNRRVDASITVEVEETLSVEVK